MHKLSLLLLCCIALFNATGQPGSLDPTFGNKGIQTTSFLSNVNTLYEQGRVVLTSTNRDIFLVIRINNSNYTRIAKYLPDGSLDSSYGNAGYSDAVNQSSTSAVMQDGKIVVAGYTYEGVYSDFALARYTADGNLDSSFGVNGRVTTDFNKTSDGANSIALQGNKIIVAGYSIHYPNYNIALARYAADGALDSTFGENGLIITDFNSTDEEATSIALQGDKIFVAGYRNGDFALVGYTASGTLDSSFGENGLIITDFDISDRATSIVLQGDQIIVAGYTYHPDSSNYDFALVRYMTDGRLDSSFGMNGKLTTDFNDFDRATSVTLQGNKIVVGGYTYNPFNQTNDFALGCYTSDGKLDSTFGVKGKLTTDFNNSDDKSSSIAIQGSKILLAGDSNGDFALARYTTDGILDSSFGINGLLTGHFPSSQASFTSAAIQENKIIAAGYAINVNNNNDFALVRYTADGTMDSSFGEHGKAITDFSGNNDEVKSIALQGDKIVVAGYTGDYPNYANYNFALARYMANGTLDSSFGVNGKVITDFNGYYDEARSIAIKEDKLIVAGFAINSVNHTNDFALVRYTADGKLDSTFGVNGKVTTDFNNSDDLAVSIVLQGDKIIVGGNAYNSFNNIGGPALVRYTSDGILDTTFGVNGKVTTDFNSLNMYAYAIALQEDKIIATGYSSGDFGLVRYTADGKLDSSFGVNGKITTDLDSTYDVANAIAIQGDKIIVAGGSYYPKYANYNFALARYMADGTLDSSFGVNGKVITDVDGDNHIQAITMNENRLYAVGNIAYLAIGTIGAIAAYQLEAPEPIISIADVTVAESKLFAVVTVRLSAPANKLVRVHFTTRDKTATSYKDYLPVNGTLLFIPGVNTTFKIYIPILNDNESEPTDQLEVRLTKAYHATIQDSVGVVTIIDDDSAPLAKQDASLQIHASPNPSAGAFTVQLRGTNLKQQVNIRVYSIDGRFLEERENISIGQILHLGDQYKPGTYIIEAVQGSRSVQTKVIKTGK